MDTAPLSHGTSSQDQGVTKALCLDQRSDHHILIWQRKCRCCFNICFRHYLRRYLCCPISSLRRMFCYSRGQSWIAKSLLSVCHKLLLWFIQSIIFQYFIILQYHWFIYPTATIYCVCHKLMIYVTTS